MIVEPDQLVTALHATHLRLAGLLSGGGAGSVAALLRVPGASRTIVELVVPYAAESLVNWLGARPEQFCSNRTARGMAMVAFQRSRLLASTESDSVVVHHLGLGCTASLASDRPKRGANRVHVALQSLDQTRHRSVTLAAGRRSRAAEDEVASALVLNSLAEELGLSERVASGLEEDEPLESHTALARPEWRELIAGARLAVAYDRGVLAASEPLPTLVFPGAFNPLHDGHRAMAEFASRRLGIEPVFELSIENVDKPLLDYVELEQRVAAFCERRLWLTRAPRFTRKAALFPGATFIVGLDTIERIGALRYYDQDEERRERAIAELAGHGCRFLVFGRLRGGKFETLADLDLPSGLRGMCQGVAESEFRHDVSSTELRAHASD